MERERQRNRRLVLVPCPFQGHINPMLQLGAILHSKGFSITIIHTQFNSLNPANHPDFTFRCVPDRLSYELVSSGDLCSLILDLNVSWQEPLRECLADILKSQSQEELACVIYDEVIYCSEAVSNQLNLPSIILRTSNATTYVAVTAVFKLIADGCLPLQDSMLQEPVPEHYPLRFKDLPIFLKGKVDNYVKLVTNKRHVGTSSAVVWSTADCLEESSLSQMKHQCHVPVFAIGPLHKFAPASSSSSSLLKEDSSCISWLDKQAEKSVIYASVGSLAAICEEELLEMAWGLANSKQPFLWVVRPGSVLGKKWTESLPGEFKEAVGQRGCIVEWAPQKQVLAHRAVGGFLTHCGWNSTVESLSEGVPLICRPFVGDQRVIARYASCVWRVGLQLENGCHRGEIETAVRRLTAEEEGKEIRLRAMGLKEKIDICTSEGGSSYNSIEELVRLILSF